MVSPAFLSLIFSLIPFTFASPVRRHLAVHESIAAPPSGFLRRRAAPGDAVLNLRIALTQGNTWGLEKALYDVSDPLSPLYGQHLSKEEVEDFVRPSTETYNAVTAWLADHDISWTRMSSAGDWLSTSMPVSTANYLLDAKFEEYHHAKSGHVSIRTLSYSLPLHLRDLISSVHPTVSFGSRGALKITPMGRDIAPLEIINATSFGDAPVPSESDGSEASVPPACDSSAISLQCLQALYDIPATPATQPSNQFFVTAYDDNTPSQADIEQFLGTSNVTTNSTFATQTVNGGAGGTFQASEADLDLQMALGLAPGVPVTLLSVGRGSDDIFLDTATYLMSLDSDQLPTVLSTSYVEDEGSISPAVATQYCNTIMQLGARGVSVIFSSGDGGVGGEDEGECTSFAPTFPSGCPFLTSVGATELTASPVNGSVETAASFSSGGFSNIWARPSFQDSAVQTYLESIGTLNAGLFNASGRGFPDVSTLGNNIDIVFQGEAETIAGTSASAPIFASMVALINDQLLAAGQKPLGWLNPFLYGVGATAFNDITVGQNPACGSPQGFPAQVGWDPITGLGTPNFAKLLAAVQGLTTAGS